MNVLSSSKPFFSPFRTRLTYIALACSVLSTSALAAKYEVEELSTSTLGVNTFAQALSPTGTALVAVQDAYLPPLDVSLRQRSNLADHVGAGDDAVAEFCIALFEVNRCCPQHEVREVDVPFVRRYVGAFC